MVEVAGRRRAFRFVAVHVNRHDNRRELKIICRHLNAIEVNENIREGLVDTVQWWQLSDAVAAGATVIDVRTPEEFAHGSIPGALNLPIDELRAREHDLPKGPLVMACAVGQRGNTAARLLSQLGHSVRNLDGGYRTWRNSPAAQQ